MTLAVLAGLLAGILIAILTVLLEHSRIAVGALALFGNGALIVPSLLAPYAIFAGWTAVLRRGGRALELAMFALGLHFGVGTTSALEVLFYPSQPGLTLFDALPGVLLTGTIFVDLTALLAGLGLLVVRRTSGGALSLATGVALLTAVVLGFFYGIGLGALAGVAVGRTEAAPSRTVVIAIALALLMLVLGNLPYIGQLFAPAPA